MIFTALVFMLLYRLPEAFLTKIFPLFLSAKVENGGLALTTQQVGFAYGTVGVIGLTLGGILGGMAVAKDGFQRWKWPMVVAYFSPQRPLLFPCLLSAEQFCVGERGYCHRTIRLWIWFYSLYAIFALLCAGRI